MPIPAFDGIVEGEGGYAKLEGTRIRVKDIAAQYLHIGWSQDRSNDEIVFELGRYFPHLTYGQVSGAISYFQKYPQLIQQEMVKEEEALHDKTAREIKMENNLEIDVDYSPFYVRSLVPAY